MSTNRTTQIACSAFLTVSGIIGVAGILEQTGYKPNTAGFDIGTHNPATNAQSTLIPKAEKAPSPTNEQ